MRITRIEIERFLGIRLAELDISKDIQVVAGPNNAGKTTLIKAINLFFSAAEEKIDTNLFQPKNLYYASEGSRALTRIRLTFEALSPEEQLIFQSAVLGRGVPRFWCELCISRLGNVSYRASKGADGQQTYNKVCDQFDIVLVPTLRINATDRRESHTLISSVTEVLLRSRPGRDTSLQTKFKSQGKKCLNQIKAVLRAGRSEVRNLLPAELRIDFKMPNMNLVLSKILPEISITLRDEVGIALEDEGTGIQSIISLGVLGLAKTRNLRGKKNLLFLIEEPEAFLHPQYQRAVASYLMELAIGSQLVVSTHSPIVLDSVDVSKIIRLPSHKSGLEFRHHFVVLSAAESGRISRYCDSRNSEIIFARRVIFVEGRSDYCFIRTLLSQFSGTSWNQQDVSLIDMDTGDNAQHFAAIAKHFDVPFLIILDKDCYFGPGKKVNKLASAIKKAFSPEELRSLDNLSRRVCGNRHEAWRVRDDANEILAEKGVFSLSSDIEGAVCSSIPRAILERLYGAEGVHYFTDFVAAAVPDERANAYHSEIFRVFKSKGWDCSNRRAEKLKPHILAGGMEGWREGEKFIRQSDLDLLVRKLREFIS